MALDMWRARKNWLTILLILATSVASYAAHYRIANVEYEIIGKTREYSLATKVKIDKKRTFTDEEALIKYLLDIKQQIENTRCFQSVEVDFAVEGDEEPFLVTVRVKTVDSHHLLILPYPKYSSNSGFDIKLKGKDTNFFGSMENMGADFDFAIEQDDTEGTTDYTFGINLSFKIPFKFKILECAWDNDFSLSYSVGETTPEWNFKTGFCFELPFDRISFTLDLYQSFVRDLDYEDTTVNSVPVHYGDGTYFTEYAKFAVPVVLQRIDNWGDIKYTPYIDIEYNWDANGISTKYPDYDAGDGLMGPVMNLGHTLSTGRINWKENFRDGLSASFGQSVSYNLNTYTFSPTLEAEFMAFKAFKYVGLCADIYGFACVNGNKSIGARLRGIRDNQYFDSDTGDDDMKACTTPAAIVMSFDLPIRIFRIYWDRIPGIKKIPHIGILNFEFQLSPFIDFALMKNRSTLTTFSPKDGFLSGGIEALIYPLKWKGIQVRVSFGVDLSRKMPFIKGRFNQEWRDAVSGYELSIGIGLQY